MNSRTDVSRRRVLAAGAGAALATVLAQFPHAAPAAEEPLKTRPIPHSGEPLPIVGIGTAIIFDFENDPAKYAERRQVIQTLVSGGGRLIDTAHSYGRAEDRLGELVADLGVRDKLFLATKFSYNADRAAATASFQASLRRLKTNRVDLMQAWNVGDANYDFGVLREWKQQGLCRYVGMTTSFIRHYDVIAKVLAREKPDFFQVNYSLGSREAESMLLPTARDAGAAVLVNLPFGRNSLFRKAGSRPLPDFAAEFGARTWAQFFLKFILSHPAVTAVIPGTDKPEYMLDNLQAGRGLLPDAAMRKRMVQYWESLT
ncbi:MAG: aldo/keto reductase [Betaproteobacteria bacterium]|nr:aldo/keto reductase [Betaproteobacteria bacterium]